MYLKTIGTAMIAIGVGFAGNALAEGTTSSAQNAAYCLQKQGGELECKYQTMAACEKDKSGTNLCIQNPKSSTTGSGMQSPAPGSAPTPSK